KLIRNRTQPWRLRPAMQRGDEGILRLAGAAAREFIEKNIPRRYQNVCDAALLKQRRGFIGRACADDATGGGEAVAVAGREGSETARSSVEAHRRTDGGRRKQNGALRRAPFRQPVCNIAFDET